MSRNSSNQQFKKAARKRLTGKALLTTNTNSIRGNAKVAHSLQTDRQRTASPLPLLELTLDSISWATMLQPN